MSLVRWKKKLDKFNDEKDDDNTEVIAPRLSDTMQEATFIRRDETNARAMKAMRMKRW